MARKVTEVAQSTLDMVSTAVDYPLCKYTPPTHYLLSGLQRLTLTLGLYSSKISHYPSPFPNVQQHSRASYTNGSLWTKSQPSNLSRKREVFLAAMMKGSKPCLRGHVVQAGVSRAVITCGEVIRSARRPLSHTSPAHPQLRSHRLEEIYFHCTAERSRLSIFFFSSLQI